MTITELIKGLEEMAVRYGGATTVRMDHNAISGIDYCDEYRGFPSYVNLEGD